MDNDGTACISEYGLEIVLQDDSSSKSIPINSRWLAPEILSKRDKRFPSVDGGKAADIYSFAMVMFEVCLPYLLPSHPNTYLNISSLAQILTGTIPFPSESDEEIVNKVTAGHRPKRLSSDSSRGMLDELWEQIVACWRQELNERPTAAEVLWAFGEAKGREPAIPVKGSNEEIIMKEWDWVESDREESTFLG